MTDSDVTFDTAFDMAAFRAKGVQRLIGFFGKNVRADLARRAQEIIAARDAGLLTKNDQDARGFAYEWFEPILKHEKLVALVTRLFGPDVAASGWRILIKDKHYREGMFVHQDWPYVTGGTDKVSIFVPLTQVNQHNGGLNFIEESHGYGPLHRGEIDPSRFPPMNHTCPDLEVGDVVVCDYLTWHYSKNAENDHERIMLQLSYQSASDASSKHLVAGTMPHERLLQNGFDAMGLPSTEMHAAAARSLFEAGNVDRARRFAAGLLADDPDHAGAAILLHDIQSAEADTFGAVDSLFRAQAIVKRLEAQIDTRLQRFQGDVSAAAQWQPLHAEWWSTVPQFPQAQPDGLLFATPPMAWAHGAVSEVLNIEGLSAIRIRARPLEGAVAICLVSEAQDRLLSKYYLLNAEPASTIDCTIPFDPAFGPTRLCIRNLDGKQAGRVILEEIGVRALRPYVEAPAFSPA